jgi:glycerate kinase
MFFGPRKGLSEAEVIEAETAMYSWSELLAERCGAEIVAVPGSGAAGGTGAALIALGAPAVSGADAIAQALDLAAQLTGADLVITGEGTFDDSSLEGKVVGVVTRLALDKEARVLLVTGHSEAMFRPEGISHRVDHLCPERELSLVDIAVLVQEFCEEMTVTHG